MTSPDEQDRVELDLLLRGFEVSRMLRLIADLEIADKIEPGATVGLDEVAAECAVLPLQLARVLRALAAYGVFQMTPDGSVAHTKLSRLLRSDEPNSMHHSARFWTAPGSWGAWAHLDVAMTDRVPHEAAWGQGRFEYLRSHPDEARIFDLMMANFPDDRHAALAAAYDIADAQVIIDVGGGSGETLRHLLARNPRVRGVAFDRDHVIGAIGEDSEALLHGRITTRSGDFFDEVPTGGDIYMLVRVLHDWSDPDCVRILRSCRAAMTPTSLLVVGELILEPDPARGRVLDYLSDVQMMAMFGAARERTADEFDSLFRISGFELRRIIATASPVSIIEAAPL